MSKLAWYWHRLRAMDGAEIAGRVRKKLRERRDAKGREDWDRVNLECRPVFPMLPDPAGAPVSLREGLRSDAEAILAGHWTAFGAVQLRVDDPPRWHRDYLAGVDLEADRVAFGLDHRALGGGADIKLIWELSRWQTLTRLAMAAHVLEDDRAGSKVADWLEDWVRCNPPYRGWNWTSALESGVRLIQWVWMDALMAGWTGRQGARARWEALTQAVLPPHAWFTWRHRSFGSSANNHLIGELAGLILAGVRWPDLASWGTDLGELQRLWEREVLAQFAEDGGNREQALHYHLFSWELCWQARAALGAAGREVSGEVTQRLTRAADFFAAVGTVGGAWDYGDSDDAVVVPFGSGLGTDSGEWHAWFNEPERSPSIRYWRGEPPAPSSEPACVRGCGDWLVYPESGQAVCWTGDWQLRWDVSPLGYLATAAHGHLDALHLSLWWRGQAVVIDPGTGAYYGDATLREYLASWEAHNGPHWVADHFPARRGPFLWAQRHERPEWSVDSDRAMAARLRLPGGVMTRKVRRLAGEEAGDGWQVDDDFEPELGRPDRAFRVCWQFPPGSRLAHVGERIYRVEWAGGAVRVGVDSAWREVVMMDAMKGRITHPVPEAEPGLCSPGFRRVAWGPRLVLTAPGHNPCLFRTTFLACGAL